MPATSVDEVLKQGTCKGFDRVACSSCHVWHTEPGGYQLEPNRNLQEGKLERRAISGGYWYRFVMIRTAGTRDATIREEEIWIDKSEKRVAISTLGWVC